MKTNKIAQSARYIVAAAAWLISTALLQPAEAADECRVKYAYSSSVITVDLDAGEEKTINKSNVLYVENLKSHKVRVYRSGSGAFVDLTQNGRDPGLGNYMGNVTLQKLECHGSSSSSPTYQTPGAMISGLKAAGSAVNEIAAAVVAAFGVGGEQLAALLKSAGYDAFEVAGALNSALTASAAEAAGWLKQAGYSIGHIAQVLNSVYGKTAQDIAGLLKAAQYDSEQIAGALKTVFTTATNGQVAQWLRNAGFQAGQVAAALANQLNLAGAQIAQAMKDAGFAAADIGEALVGQLNAGAANVAQWLRQAGFSASQVAAVLVAEFNDSAALMGQWLKQAGYSAAEIGEVLKNQYSVNRDQAAQILKNLAFSANDVATVLRVTFNSTAQQAADLLTALYDLVGQALRSALQAAGYAAAEIEAALTPPVEVGGVLSLNNFYGRGSSNGTVVPLYINPQPLTYEVRGSGLTAITQVTRLPVGATGEVGFKEDSRLRLTIQVPEISQVGRTGTADLFAGGTKVGSFDWQVTAMPRVGDRDTGSGSTAPAPTRSLPDAAPTTFVNSLYRVGSATTTDANGDTFTALDPFNNSPFCQGIPDGQVTRDNRQTSNRRDVTVPDIRWGVRNTSTVDITTSFTIKLLRGNQELASQRVRSLSAGDQVEFRYVRPQSTVTVAKVGLGGGCFHAGLRGEGWNDNAGFQVRVDTGNDVGESNEHNNSGAI